MIKKRLNRMNMLMVLVVILISGSLLYGSFGFALKDMDGKTVHFTDVNKKKGVILAFISTRCPVSNAYNERMEAINEKYKDDFRFIGINSNRAETPDMIREHANRKGLTFTILKDTGNKLADQLMASFTPEIFVFNPGGDLLYHGRIDNSRRKDRVTKRDLENALREIIAGKPVLVKETKAFGCSIKRIKK